MKRNRIIKSIAAMLLSCAVLLSGMLGGVGTLAFALDPDDPAQSIGDNLTWSIENGVLTISGTGAMRDFEAEYGGPDGTAPWGWDYNRIVIGNGVTHIGSWAFYGSPATSVSIPNSVTSIGNGAFAESALSRVTIPGSVTDWPEAFIMCGGLTSVVVSEGVEKLDNMCFAGCEFLSGVTLPFSLREIGEGAFHMCHQLNWIQIPYTVTSIDSYAFCDTGLISIVLPSEMTTISEGMFEMCASLTEVYIPEGVTRIEDTAFYGCDSLETLHIPRSVQTILDPGLGDGQCANFSYICCENANGAAAQYAQLHDIEFRQCVPADHGGVVALSLFMNGGTWVHPDGEIITWNYGTSQEMGSTFALPTDLIRDGYRFTGWYDTRDCSGTPYDSIYTFGRYDQILYAGWEEIVHTDTPTLTIDPNGGAFANGSTTAMTVTQTTGSTYTLPTDLTLQGHTLSGWSLRDTNVGTIEDGVYTFGDIDETVLAQWTLAVYTLALGNVGSVPEGSAWRAYFSERFPHDGTGMTAIRIQMPYGTLLTLPTASEMFVNGYSFEGWFTLSQLHSDQPGTGATSYTFSQDGDLYAKWSPNTYTVTIDLNGGYRNLYTSAGEAYRSTDPYTVSIFYGAWMRLLEYNRPILRDGYRLVGFTGVNGSPVAGSFVQPDANSDTFNDLNQVYYYFGPTDETLVAQWEKIPEDQISVTIGDQIGVNLLLDLDARNAETVTVVYKDLNGVEQRETFTDFSTLPQVEGGLYKIAVQIAPAQIADTVTVYIDGETLSASVKNYCNTLTAGDYEPEVVALAQAVLDYGQAANNFFDYTDETISAVTNLSADDAKAWAPVFADTTGKIRSISFMALTKPEFRFYTRDITEAEAAAYNAAGVTAAYADTSITETLNARFVKNQSGDILIEVTGVMAEYMDETIVVTIDGLGTITFAGNDFAKMMADNASMEALGAALYAYGAAAKACFRPEVDTVDDGMEVPVPTPGGNTP